MLKKYLPISLLITEMFLHSILAQEVNTKDIETVKIQLSDMPNNFFLFQERIAKPGAINNEQIYQLYRFNFIENDLVLIEEIIHNLQNPVGASSFQKWYRYNENGKKDKIEIDIIICSSDDEMYSTISYFTTNAYTTPMHSSEIPIVGERSWIPIYSDTNLGSQTLMFLKFNIFVRVFVRLPEADSSKLGKSTIDIAKIIENKILAVKN